MISPNHPKLSVRRKRKLPDVNRNRLQKALSISGEDHAIIRDLDEIHPYLPGNLEVTDVDQVWCADITCLPIDKGHAYLVAVMDWKTRAVLGREVGNTMDSAFCVRALRAAMKRTERKPKIFNTGQGSQFTGEDWMNEPKDNGIEISMDGKGRWMDNVFIERLWRSPKYEKIRSYGYPDMRELRGHVEDWMHFHNHKRTHQHLDYTTPRSNYGTSPSHGSKAA